MVPEVAHAGAGSPVEVQNVLSPELPPTRMTPSGPRHHDRHGRGAAGLRRGRADHGGGQAEGGSGGRGKAQTCGARFFES
jgi:hypothetical protein